MAHSQVSAPGPSALVQEGLTRARALLKQNRSPFGITAASPASKSKARGYTRVFARDSAICALGIAADLDPDPDLLDAAKTSLLTIARHQADNGQIPKYVDPESRTGDFWYLGCIDATLWWLIAVDFLVRNGAGEEFEAEVRAPAAGALDWLRCQEHPRLGLVQQNEASDWADIMPRSGFVLYTNALWYHVKRLFGLAGAEATKYHFNHLFYPFSNELPDYKRLRLLTHYVRSGARPDPLYLSFVNFSFWGEEGDVFGNLLAILMGLADDGPASRILRALTSTGVHRPYPVRAVARPIARTESTWRAYMGRHRQNLEFQYHNGGIWPFIGAFWVMALASRGRLDEARRELELVAAANALHDWEFNEWLYGLTGEPSGMPGQSWNAASLLLACSASTGRGFPVRSVSRLAR